MSARATGTSSVTQKYCCLSREPQVLCSRLNEMARLASVAEKSLTGMDTSPKDTVNDAIDRAAIVFLRRCGKNVGERIVIQRDFSGFGALQRVFQALLSGQSVAPAIAGLCQTLRSIRNAEIERMRAGQLLPGKRHRYRGPWCASRRVGNVQRLAAHVHVVVHEDLSRPFGHAPFERDVLRMQLHEVAPHSLGYLARGVEIDGAADRHEDVQARLSRGLHDRLEPHAVQELAQAEGHLLAFPERDGVELGFIARGFLARVNVRVDIEYHVDRVVESRPF